MPEFQASHFFILKILQCRIFTAFLIGIANLFRNYLFLYGWIPIGELCTFYFFFRSSDFPLANPPRNLRYSLFFGFTFVQICNCGGLKRVIFLSFPYSLPLWYVYEHILPPKSPTVNRFFQFFHFSFLLYHSVIP